MLIDELIEDVDGIREYNENLNRLEISDPDVNWNEIRANSVYDRIIRYADWVNEVRKDRGIRLVADEYIPDCAFVGSLNCEYDLEKMTRYKISHDSFDEMYWRGYGLCDNAEQAVAEYNRLICEGCGNKGESYVLILSPIFRRNQPQQYGFRYHKWGEYIGTQSPQYEYLYDDIHIDMLYSYHIHKIEG